MRKDEKLKEVVRALAAQFVERESNRSSMITVTGVEIVDRGRKAIILFTALPEEKEKEAHKFLVRQRSDFQEYVREQSRLSRVPFFDFKIDLGEKNRQNIDKLL